MRPSILASAFVSLLAPAARAQLASDVFLVETTHDQLVRLTDIDGDGRFASPGEVRALYYDGMGGTNFSSPRSVCMRLEAGLPVLYWIDTQRDQLFNAVDASGNGQIDVGEENRFRFIIGQDGATSPDGLELSSDGGVWWCSDGGLAVGLYRIEDLDQDGDANDGGESVHYVSGGLAHSVETSAGPVAIDTGAMLRLVAAGKGVVAYVQGEDEALYRFEDLNSDGDLLDAGESKLFLNASGKKLGLPLNADWQAGLLRSLVLPGPSGNGFAYARLNYLGQRLESGQPSWYLATNNSISFNALNVNGQGVNGLVFRARDLNLDGDVQDAGEVRLFYDGSSTSAQVFGIDQINGLDVGSDGIYLGALSAGHEVVHRLRDLNGDGDAADANEQNQAIFDYAQWGLAEPFFLGNPYVWDIGVAPKGSFNNFFVVSGTACAPGADKPTLACANVPKQGTSNFELRVQNVPAGIPAFIYMGASSTSWQGIPLPLDLALIGLPGCFLYQDALVRFETLTSGLGPLGGSAKLSAPIPVDPVLNGGVLPTQWVLIDLTSPGVPILVSQLGQVYLQS